MKYFSKIGKMIPVSLVAGFLLSFTANPVNTTTPTPAAGSKIQIAILFDTSNSMDGLIEQAKTRIWSIVNTMAYLRHGQEVPTVEIALFEYGNDFLKSEDDYVNEILPLSTDLDLVSEKLFQLRTNGGSEYCGAVISKSMKGLKWSTNPGDIRLIYIAGNEPFDQGGVNYKTICAEAASKDIKVNTIYCGDYQMGIKELWYDGAQIGKGEYSNIDPNQAVAQIATPYDDQINIYNDSLNQTYLNYGSGGADKMANQMAQDFNAVNMSKEVMVERAVAKSSSNYRNESWDLVDAKKRKKDLKLSEIKEEELPSEMQGKTLEEKEKIVAEKSADRDRYQQKIQELSKLRSEYITTEMKKSNNQESDLGAKINANIQKVAMEKGFIIQK